MYSERALASHDGKSVNLNSDVAFGLNSAPGMSVNSSETFFSISVKQG